MKIYGFLVGKLRIFSSPRPLPKLDEAVWQVVASSGVSSLRKDLLVKIASHRGPGVSDIKRNFTERQSCGKNRDEIEFLGRSRTWLKSLKGEGGTHAAPIPDSNEKYKKKTRTSLDLGVAEARTVLVATGSFRGILHF
jgi:hypothetical protein